VLLVFAQEAGMPPQLVDHWKTLAEQMPAADYKFQAEGSLQLSRMHSACEFRSPDSR
jgi:hypothetical protein